MAVIDASSVLLDGPWEHRMVAANGARFHVAECGSGPLVLLVHGFPQMWWTWRHTLPALAAAGYRAAALDLRGFGASDKPPRGYDPATLSADIAGVIRSLGSADAVLVGHGIGGMLSWTTAVAHPKVVRRLVAVAAPHPLRFRAAIRSDPRQLRLSRHVLGFQSPWLPERRLLGNDGAYVGHLLRAWSAPGGFTGEETEVYRRAIQIAGVAHCSLEYSRWAVRSIVRPDGIRYAAAMKVPLTVPVLHLHGGADGAVLPRSAQGSGRQVEAPYRWQLMDGVGHFPQEENPEEFLRLLLGWLGDGEQDT